MIYEELVNGLLSDVPSVWIKNNEERIFDFIPELKVCKGFDQKNEWHVYDVYEHILHVVDGVECNTVLRLAALFHDIGKPISFQEDSDGVGHFFGHWDESIKIFDEFANKNSIDEDTRLVVTKLIFYHDLNFGRFDDSQLDEITTKFNSDEIRMLYNLKRADILAQNEKFHALKLDEYDNQEEKLLSRYNNKTNR